MGIAIIRSGHFTIADLLKVSKIFGQLVLLILLLALPLVLLDSELTRS